MLPRIGCTGTMTGTCMAGWLGLTTLPGAAAAVLPASWGELDGWSWARILDCSTEGFGG
eukprot:COSAG01_NODE_52148_length_348_cov_68.128514_1_plen_58_part_01